MGPKANKNLTLDDLNSNIINIMESMTFQNSKFEEMLSTQSSIMESLKVNTQEVEVLKKKYKDLETSHNDLLVKVHQMDQQGLSSSLEISGINEDKDITEVSKELFTLIKANHLQPISIEKKKTLKSSTIIIKMNNKEARDAVLQAKKSFGPVVIDGTNVYIRELLSPYTRELLWMCNSQRVNLQYKYAWVKNGTVMMRKNDSSKVLYIKSKQCIPIK